MLLEEDDEDAPPPWLNTTASQGDGCANVAAKTEYWQSFVIWPAICSPTSTCRLLATWSPDPFCDAQLYVQDHVSLHLLYCKAQTY